MSRNEPSVLVGTAYVLHDKLGEGGMGAVFRATQRLTGRQVALKRVHMKASEPSETKQAQTAHELQAQNFDLRLSLAHEFEMLASLHHPNVVSVIDYGFDSDQNPFFVMELLESPQTIVEASIKRPLNVKVNFFVQLLQALLYLHRRNILHCDIKPSNVLVVNDQVKLVDFGIAATAGSLGLLAGTIDYMAPELFLGLAPSPASDLYALGVLAFELFTETFPHFANSSRSDLLASILGDDDDSATVEPSVLEEVHVRAEASGGSVTSLLADASPRFDSDMLLRQLAELGPDAASLGTIISKLLAHEISNRYEDTAHVIADLSRIFGEELLIETAATRESFLVAAELVGREQEMLALQEKLDAAISGKGSVVTLTGESGIGKSRLTHELRTIALVRSARVVHGQCSAEKGSNYQLWVPVLRAMCLNTEISDQDLGTLLDIVPDLEALLDRKAVVPPSLSPQAAQARLYSAIERLFGDQKKPLVVILEDLQWAESESLDLIALLRPIVCRRPVLILGNYRVDEATPALRNMSVDLVLRIERLSRTQIARLATSMLGAAGGHPDLIEYLHRQTEGNVFFMIEVVRALAELAGQLARIAMDGLPKQLVTNGIDRILGRRLEKVPAVYLPMLQLAAVIGRRPDLKILSNIQGLTNIVPWLQACANAAVLEAQQGEWLFTHDKLRELLLAQIEASQLRNMHCRVAEEIIKTYGENSGQDVVLAYHWRRAEEHERAFKHSLRAGQAAARLYAVVEAREHFANAAEVLELLPDTVENRRRKIDTLFLLVSMSTATERSEQTVLSMNHAENLLESLRREGVYTPADHARLAKVYFWKGRGYYHHGQLAEGMQSYRKAHSVAAENGDRSMQAMSSGMLGRCMHAQGYLKQSESMLAAALAWLEPRGHNDDWARMESFQGTNLIGLGEVTKGLASIHRALQVAKDPLVVASGYMHYTIAYLYIEDWPTVEEMGKKALHLMQETRDELFCFLALCMIGWAQTWLNKQEESACSRTAALAILKSRKRIWGSELFWVAEADAELGRMRLAEAVQHIQTAINHAREAGSLYAEGLAHRTWARALFASNPQDLHDVRSHIIECIRLLEAGPYGVVLANTRMMLGVILFQDGDVVGARAQFELAVTQYTASELPEYIAKGRLALDDIDAGSMPRFSILPK